MNTKPIGMKAYRSIPHLPNSRLGPGDWSINEGQARILCEKARDKYDRIIVTEKLDGSCVAVAKVSGELVALGRAGFTADSSPHQHIRDFAEWVRLNSDRFVALPDGKRLCGEWVSMAHGTIYAPLNPPFVPFDLMERDRRLPLDEFLAVSAACGLPAATILHDGGPCSVERALRLLGPRGHHGALEDVEGCVWRCERKGEVDFVAKFVRHSKIDGLYLPGTEACKLSEPVYFWRPSLLHVAGSC